jgi:hypothetical protein
LYLLNIFAKIILFSESTKQMALFFCFTPKSACLEPHIPFQSIHISKMGGNLYLPDNQHKRMRVKTTFIHIRILIDHFRTCFFSNFATAIV